MATISAAGSIRYTIIGMNAREQLTAATYGSNLAATYGFDAYGYPSSTTTGTVQDYRYAFNPATGNLTSRQNNLRGNSESFTYDNLDRLLTATGTQNLTMTYNANGNLNTKSDIGTTAFGYGTGAGPYALTGVTSSTNIIPAVPQDVYYNSFGKISSINESNGSQTIQANFVYNSDNQRAKMTVGVYYGAEIMTRYYVGGSYMKEVQPYTFNEYTYLGGDAYTAPVVVHNERGLVSYYYLLRDYLGNITHQVNTSNTLKAEFSFDAWGRRRNATNWSYTLDANDKALFADRGFTGHEYLSWFKLYNMNGRLYDPAVGRFLNADPYVQMPDYTQNFNRYSYCLNNPLRYTDISGYTWGIFKPFVKAAKWVWNEGLPAIDPEQAFINFMQAINDNTEELRKKMEDAGIPDFNVGVSLNGAGNVNVKGDIEGHEVLNTENIDRSNAVQVTDRAITKARADGSSGIESALFGAGLSVGQAKMYNQNSWFSIKQWKTYSQTFNGNGSTGGRVASAKTVSNTFKWTGRGMGAYSAYSTNQDYQNGEINAIQMTLDQTSNALSTFGGIYGASWGIGWEMGRGITNWNSYQEWKQDNWLPWRYKNLGY